MAKAALVDSRLEPIVDAAVAFSAKATWNKRICSSLAAVLHDCHQVAKTSGMINLSIIHLLDKASFNNYFRPLITKRGFV